MIFEITVTAGVLGAAALLAALHSSLKTGLTVRPYEPRLQPMTNSAVNSELLQAFGARECAGDSDEAETTPYTSEADRKRMVELALADTLLVIDVTVVDDHG